MSDGLRWDEQRVASVLTELAAGATTVSLYGPDHPRAGQSVDRLANHLSHLLEGNSEFSLVVLGEELFAQGQPVTRSCRQAPSLLRRFRRRDIEVVTVRSGVLPGEIRQFLLDLAVTDDTPFGQYTNISVGQVHLSESELGGPDARHGGRGTGAMATVRDRVELVFDCFESLRREGRFTVSPLETVADAVLAAVRQNSEPLRLLARWRGEEHWAAVHAHNTCVFCLALASGAAVGAMACRDLGIAALSHHVGKLLLSPEIQEKELELGSDELELMLDHPLLSLETLLGNSQTPPLALVTAFEHHLNFNGSGFPRLPRPRRPHPASRLVSLASSTAILVNVRMERRGISREYTEAWLHRRSGTVFDPDMTTAMIELLATRETGQSPG